MRAEHPDFKCARCGRDAHAGSMFTIQGISVGRTKLLLCGRCTELFGWFLTVDHVKASDPVTAVGLAHIGVCPECHERFGGGASMARTEGGLYNIITKQRVAERFNQTGQAQ